MPKQTFYNLTEEKQNKIIEAAKQEFSANSFYDASINQIIKDAGISRGSFYQYFETKEDLFAYLVEQCTSSFFTELKSQVPEQKVTIVELCALIFDMITRSEENLVWKPFFVTTLSNASIKFMMHMEKYLMNEVKECSVREISAMISWDDIAEQYVNQKYMVYHLFGSTMMFFIGASLNDMEHKEQYRKAMCAQFEMMKTGIMRKGD